MTDQEQQIADYQLRLIRIVKGCSRLIDEHDSLRADLFPDPTMRAIFSAIVAVLNDGLEVEETAIAAALTAAGRGELIATMAGLDVASPANVVFYIDALREESRRRTLARAVDDARDELAEGKRSFEEIRAELERSMGGEDRRRGILPASFDDYFTARVEWDPKLDFRPQLFGALPFPRGTVSYVGARTARGKSAVLVNLAREALLQGRRAVYITLELSPAQLFDRFILSTAKASSAEDLHSSEPLKELYSVLKASQGRAGPGDTAFSRAVSPAMAEIRAAVAGDRLAVLDVRGAPLSSILSIIRRGAKAGDVVLLDYIQRLPSKSGAASEGYERMKAVSDEVINATVASSAVLIAAAQFNRQGTAPGQDDAFSDASFRESGDLEQDAHNAIGLGWTADKKGRFYEVLKARESAGTGDTLKLEWDGAFQYLKNTGERYIPTKARETKSRGQDAGKTNDTDLDRITNGRSPYPNRRQTN